MRTPVLRSENEGEGGATGEHGGGGFHKLAERGAGIFQYHGRKGDGHGADGGRLQLRAGVNALHFVIPSHLRADDDNTQRGFGICEYMCAKVGDHFSISFVNI